MGRFFKEWWPGILATLILGVDIMTNYPDVQLSWGMILFLVFAFIQMVLPQITLNKIKNSKPNLKVKNAYVDKRDVLIRRIVKDGDLIGYSSETGTFSRLAYESSETYGGTSTYRQFPSDARIESYYFAHIAFVNEPKSSMEYAAAKKVWAEIEFYNNGKKLLWSNIKGHWSDTTQPMLPNQIKRDLLQVDFEPNQLEWELDIATRHMSEDIGFVFNNDSYEFTEFIRNDMVLREEVYFVRVTLRGIGLKPEGDTFCFRLENRKEISNFDISEVDCF
jgi:hypothetical protein